jgi:16S rRNA (guanine(966)-N(2))-methyltransferase RsmD
MARVAGTATGPRRSAGRSAGRVVAGTARGLRLEAPQGETRPLGDRLKEALFAILEPELRGQAFLDLFAGSGAGGIEALSRGARRVVFVERNGDAIATLGRNLSATRLEDRAVVHRADVREWLTRAGRAEGPFAVVLVDPPYADVESLMATLGAVAAAGPDGILAQAGVVVAKHGRRESPGPGIGLLRSARERRFGESVLTFLRWAPADQEAP